MSRCEWVPSQILLLGSAASDQAGDLTAACSHQHLRSTGICNIMKWALVPIVTDSAFGLMVGVGDQRPWILPVLLTNALSSNYSVL
eukprot:5818631-Amphidinium_carterae.1